MPFRCLVKTKGKRCPYGPFKFRLHLNDHMRKTHSIVLPKVKSGPKVTSVIKKDEKKKPRVINAKEMNYKVMTNSLKRARKEFWKKSKQWETRAKVAWEKLEAKTNGNKNIGVCPTLLALIQKAHKLEELLGIVALGKGIIDVTKFEKLHNSQILATLVRDTPISNKKVTKTMRNSFLSKDWEQNENARKEFIAPILTWHRTKFSSNM